MDAPKSPQVNWRLGTMGFSYDDWTGPFYPEGTKAADRLTWYSKFFDTVELDTTFYAAPPPERVAKWVTGAPEHFRFCLKTPRAITHDSPISAGAAPMRDFVEICRGFGQKLGVVLIQFPPSFQSDQGHDLEKFLATLPADTQFAVELRHRSWGTARTLQMLHEHRCAFVSAEYAERPGRVFATTDFLYVRWIGVHHQFPKYVEELKDPTDDLKWWKQAIEPVLPKVKTVWGFFNNDYAGYAITTANRFKRLIGEPVSEPVLTKTPGLFD
jgi:uncharacterized protein YecE (DUF72 family)